MADGLLEKGPIYSDITKFVPSAELSKVILGMIGGFPCQVHHVNQLELGVFFLLSFCCFICFFRDHHAVERGWDCPTRGQGSSGKCLGSSMYVLVCHLVASSVGNISADLTTAYIVCV